jgi:hypothetical protein
MCLPERFHLNRELDPNRQVHGFVAAISKIDWMGGHFGALKHLMLERDLCTIALYNGAPLCRGVR